MRRKSKISIIYLIIVAVIWGSGFVASSLAITHNSTNAVMMLRFTIATVVLFLLKHKVILLSHQNSRRHGIILGVFLYLAFYFQTKGLEFTTASNNAFITSTNILIVPIIALIIDKKRIRKSEMAGLMISLVGLLLLTSNGKIEKVNVGDLLTLVSAFFFALHIFFTGKFVLGYNEEETIGVMFYQMLTASLLSIIMIIISKDMILLNYEAILPVAYLGLVSTLLAYFLQTTAQKYVDHLKTAMILSTEAIFGALFSFLLLKERLSIIALLGGGLIFIGIMTVEYFGEDGSV